MTKLKVFCIENKCTLSFAKQFCTDVSFALFGAVLKTFNNQNIPQYINSFYEFLTNSQPESLKFVIVEFCKCHYKKIICKDLNEHIGKNFKLRQFVKSAMSAAFTINTLSACKDFFRSLFYILCAAYTNDRFWHHFNKFQNMRLVSDAELASDTISERAYQDTTLRQNYYRAQSI